jgi:hypothetical protein
MKPHEPGLQSIIMDKVQGNQGGQDNVKITKTPFSMEMMGEDSIMITDQASREEEEQHPSQLLLLK